jgi:hypothetical protein
LSEASKPPPPSEITPEGSCLRRREFLRHSLLFTATSSPVGGTLLWLMRGLRANDRQKPASPTSLQPSTLTITRQLDYSSGEAKTPYDSVTSYNNFYEFGVDKSDPAENAHTLKTRPWTIAIEGEVKRPQIIDIDRLLEWFPLEERVYRMRCVEAWSMVIRSGLPTLGPKYSLGRQARFVFVRWKSEGAPPGPLAERVIEPVSLRAIYSLGTISPNSPSASSLIPAVKYRVFGSRPCAPFPNLRPHTPEMVSGPPESWS